MKFRFVVRVSDPSINATWVNEYVHDLFTWDSAMAEAQGQVAALNEGGQGPWMYCLVSVTLEK